MKKKTETVDTTEPTKIAISPLGLSFGQEDLNKMVEKINEIIACLNDMV